MAWPGSPSTGRVTDHRGCGGRCGMGRWGWTPTGAGAQQHLAGMCDGVPTAGVPAARVPTAGVPTAGVPTAGVTAAGVPTARPVSSAGSWVSRELPALPGTVLGELLGGAGWGRVQQGGLAAAHHATRGLGRRMVWPALPAWAPCSGAGPCWWPCRSAGLGVLPGAAGPIRCYVYGGARGARAAPSQGWCRLCCLPGLLPPAVPDPRHRPHRAAAGNKGLQRGCAQR